MPPSDPRGGLCGPGKSRVAARAGRAVDEEGSAFSGLRGWLVSKRGKVTGDVLHVVVLVVVVVRVVARWGVVDGIFRRRILGIVVQTFAPDGADGGVDPIVEGSFALAFRYVIRVGCDGCRWGHCGSSAKDIAHG